MKIGILTFHWADNYGAVLQAFALSNYINEVTEDAHVEIVDYVRSESLIIYRPFIFRSHSFIGIVKSVIKGIIKYPVWHKKHMGFEAFRKRMPISKQYSKEQLFNSENDYDIWVTGSDQVWNPEIVGNDYDIYDLSFVKNKKKCSYAASSGEFGEELSDIQKKILLDIRYLDYISVREKSTQQYLIKKTNKEAELVLDPTFLIEADKWREIAGNKRLHKKDYLFIYFISLDQTLIDAAEIISKKYGLDIVVCGYVEELKGKAIQYKSASPVDFLNLLMNSKIVLASSFHAIVFSILFEKQFFAITPSYASNRVVDLCESVGLGNRIIHNGDEINDIIEEKINYEIVTRYISDKKYKSMEYITQILHMD